MPRLDNKIVRFLAKSRASYRTILRESRLLLIFAAGIAGFLGGSIASLMGAITQYLHEILLGVEHNTRLSSATELDIKRTFLVLILGGLLVGISTALWRWWRKTGDIVDPVEANALHGGRMSFRDSLFVMFQSIMSDGVGASVGLEGGFSQAGGALGSKIGIFLHRRRNDIRMLVGAGAAGAIAGAFDSTFAGAAYGFELIIGSYTVATLAPITTAAICGVFAASLLAGHGYRFPIESLPSIQSSNLFWIIFLGVLSALLAVLLMRGVTRIESFFRSSNFPIWSRPMLGGLVVATFALVSPNILASGHGGMEIILSTPPALTIILAVLLLKIIACAVSIGAGFRGGLFSASLFLGVLAGAAFTQIGTWAGVLSDADFGLYTLIGMASFAAAVVGAPMTMVALAVGMSGQMSALVPSMIGVIAAMLTVRRIFGYSFATWRFHLRGEAILGGQDIGWLYKTSAQELMRRGPPVARSDQTIAEFCEQFPLASARYVIGIDQEQAFSGIIDVALAHARSREEGGAEQYVSDILTNASAYIGAHESLSRVMPKFERLTTEILVVVDTEEHRRVLGIISEEYALKMYQQQLEERQKEIFAG
ncbi:chloride channel protein [Microvirga sp. W0021]|uniref:Chloride channel protein n=1 Tax=Hohaiivirga grylli TaxID=3133970 RepID=A0ABV0BI24_9HYPH